MKRTLFAAAIVTLALAVGASAEEQQQGKRAAGTNRGARAATAPARVNAGGNAHARQVNVRQNTSARTFNNRAAVNRQSNAIVRSNARANRVTAREQGVNRARTINNSNVVTRTTNRERFARAQNIQRDRAVTRNVNRNMSVNRNVNRDVTVNRTRNINRNVTLVNNWRGQRFAGRNYVAFRNYHRAWHDRGWWTNHYNRIIFVSGGWYFWNGGYWYPAWGYDTGSVYPYDGPIYGYGSLSPDQVVVNVQEQLQNDGYYSGPIDGVLGPDTRYALAAFQADNGLAVTSAVDQPTLSTLGLV